MFFASANCGEDQKKAAPTLNLLLSHRGDTPAALCPLLGDAGDSLMLSQAQGRAPTPRWRWVGGRASGDAVTGRLTRHRGSPALLSASHAAAAGLRQRPRAGSPRPTGEAREQSYGREGHRDPAGSAKSSEPAEDQPCGLGSAPMPASAAALPCQQALLSPAPHRHTG